MTANVCDECGTGLDETDGGLCVTCAWWQDDEERREWEAPADLNTCAACNGSRSILPDTRDPATVIECPRCDGTGHIRNYLARTE